MYFSEMKHYQGALWMIHSGSSQQALWMDYNHRLYPPPQKTPNMDNDTVFSLMVKVREAGNNLTFINYLDQKKKKITFFIRKAKIINLGSTCILVIGRI